MLIINLETLRNVFDMQRWLYRLSRPRPQTSSDVSPDLQFTQGSMVSDSLTPRVYGINVMNFRAAERVILSRGNSVSPALHKFNHLVGRRENISVIVVVEPNSIS